MGVTSTRRAVHALRAVTTGWRLARSGCKHRVTSATGSLFASCLFPALASTCQRLLAVFLYEFRVQRLLLRLSASTCGFLGRRPERSAVHALGRHDMAAVRAL